MNFEIIRYVVGWILNVEAALMVLPLFVSLIYHEHTWLHFLMTIVLCLVFGILLTYKKPKNKVFYMKEGFVSTALSWLALSLFGAIPFIISGYIPNPVDAIFETISGFTTTGASILTDVEALTHGLLFWRSFTHWIGGMGILVFILAILPLTGGYQMNLMKAESPGPSVSRLVPKVQETAKWLYGIYFGLTVIEVILLLLGKMPLFDALTTSFGTAGTGGFGIKNDSIGGYSTYLQDVVTIFMILFGVNFSAYFLILTKKVKQALKLEEVRAYFGIILLAIVVIGCNTVHMWGGIVEAMHHSAFQVASIITTTGFSTTDFNQWPEMSKTILILLMFIGACAGSTGGGIKVSRFVILFKTIRKELYNTIHPTAVKRLKMDGKTIEHEVVRNVNVYLITFIVIFVISILLISVDQLSFTTNFTAVAATFNNIGPGLEMVGPTSNFSIFSNFSKIILSFDMLAGRLEIFPILILIYPETWKKY